MKKEVINKVRESCNLPSFISDEQVEKYVEDTLIGSVAVLRFEVKGLIEIVIEEILSIGWISKIVKRK